MRTGDQTFIKELNKSITIDLVRRRSPISRAQISVESGLNKATVSALIDELIDQGLIVELGPGHSSVGRRPVMLGFNATAGYVIGIEVGVDYIRTLLMNLSGSVVSSEEVPLSQPSDVQGTVSTLSDLIKHTASSAPRSELGVIGVGVGVPGLVDFSDGIVLNAPNLHWSNVPLKSYLEAHVQYPVFIDNEANTGALAEGLFGRGLNASSFVYLSVGTGIGTGIMINGNLIRGSEGTAGEFGHMVIETQGVRCSCGNRGCLEMYASERALVSKYHQLTGRRTDAKEIISQLEHNSPDAFQTVQSVAKYLGVGISNIINSLNPAMVIIGNTLSVASTWLIPQIEQIIGNSSLRNPPSQVKVEVASLGRDATSIGAGALIINDYFLNPLTKG